MEKFLKQQKIKKSQVQLLGTSYRIVSAIRALSSARAALILALLLRSIIGLVSFQSTAYKWKKYKEEYILWIIKSSYFQIHWIRNWQFRNFLIARVFIFIFRIFIWPSCGKLADWKLLESISIILYFISVPSYFIPVPSYFIFLPS